MFLDPEGVVSLIAGGVSLRKEGLSSFFKPRRGDRIWTFPQSRLGSFFKSIGKITTKRNTGESII
jgi:hypothetical protein